MSIAQKWAAGLILIGLVTAATLPGRQTVPVANAARKFVTGSEATAITGKAS
jgi:hypothetical protein